jgi:hypothetical protein
MGVLADRARARGDETMRDRRQALLILAFKQAKELKKEADRHYANAKRLEAQGM